jgi:hypothetical protein
MDSNKNSVTVLAILLFVLAALTHAVAAQKAMEASEHPSHLENVRLGWLAVTQASELDPVNLTGIAGLKIEVGTFLDVRDNPLVVGENRMYERQGLIKQVTTQDHVGRWASRNVGSLLEDFGMNTVEQDGDVLLTGEVRRLMVVETGAYEGEVALFIRAQDRTGQVCFEGMTGGLVRRFGRPYDGDNYVEAMSEALMEAVHHVLSSTDFRLGLADGSIAG